MTTNTAEEWRTLDDFTYGMDTNRLPSTGALAGRELTVTLDGEAPGGGRSVRQVFEDATTMRWVTEAGETRESYDAVEFADDIFLVDIVRRDAPRESVSQVLSPRTRRVLTVTSTIAEEKVPDEPQVGQRFTTGVIGDPAVTPDSPVPAPTRELIGQRALYSYSPHHLYEHVYLNSARYAWQCLVGAQRGHGDVDLVDIYKFDESVHIVCWREFRIPVACVWAYNWTELRTVGKFFGLTGDGEIDNSPAGAHITVLPEARYPEGVVPA